MARLGRLVAVALVAVVGTGACAFEPRQDGSGSTGPEPVAADVTSGASAPPGPVPAGQAPTTAAPPRPATAPARPAQPPSPATAPASRPPATASRPPAPGCQQGEHQREVEQHLAGLGGFGPVTVDGTQSAADCSAIRKFQRRYGISPAAGRAGPTTVDVARRLAGTRTDRCRAGSGTTICVDLTRQTVWVQRGGRVVLGPTVTRTGMSGFATPAGTYQIGWKNLREWSNPYEVWMPYWQQFNGGIGFHETVSYLHDGSIGSHGCVNLLPADARRLWELGSVGTRVYLFGRRPGT